MTSKPHLMTLRMSPKMREAIEAASEREDVSASEYIRRSVLEALRRMGLWPPTNGPRK